MFKTLVGLLVLAIGCGGGAAEGPPTTTAAGTGSGAKAAGAGDASFEVAPIPISGVLFEPEALGRPGMPLVNAKRATTIDKQRKVFEATKEPVLKQAQAAVLATMLYLKSKDAKGDEQTKLLTEARQALLDSETTLKATDKADDITLRLLGTYDLILEDFPGAEAAWGQLVADAPPKDKDALFNRTWWAYALLKNYKNADALAAVKDQPLDVKQPELAYVTAWAKWRTGDNAGAWQAIVTAAQGWGTANKEALDRDVLQLAGLTNVSLADALTALMPIYGKTKTAQYDLFAKLGQRSYGHGGRWADGVAAIEKAIAVAGSTVPPNDLPVLRFTEADYMVRLDDPVKAAAFAKQALDALPACGTKCSNQEKENLVENVYVMGNLFHNLYATAHDDRYYEPAHDLYAAAIPLITMNDTMRAAGTQAQGYLEGSFRTMKAGAGKYDRDRVGALLERHAQEVQACYERGLAANPKLAGTLVVNLEVDQTGAVRGINTDPRPGLQDLAMVAGCVQPDAKAWRLPALANGKGVPVTTRIKLTFNLTAAKPATQSAQK